MRLAVWSGAGRGRKARRPGRAIVRRWGLAACALALPGPQATAQSYGTATVLPLPAGATGGSASLVNADGTVVVGNAGYPGVIFTPPAPFAPGTYTPNRPWRWTGGAASVDLGPAMGHLFNGAAGISFDGAVLAGTSSSPFSAGIGWRWTADGGYDVLPLPGAAAFGGAVTGISVRGLSGDGLTVVGGTDGAVARGFRWTAAGGYENIGLPAGNAANGLPWSSSIAVAASQDGSVLAATLSGSSVTTTQRAARWTAAGGFEVIEPVAGFERSRSHGISRDGTVIAGDLLGSGGAQQAFRWTAAGGVQPLGYVPNGTFSFFTGMSGDGSRIVGNSGRDGAGSFQVPFLWSAADGMRTLDAVVSAAGVELGGLALIRANGMSDSGSAVVGTARTSGGQTIPFLLLFDAAAEPVLSSSFSTTTRRSFAEETAVARSFATTVVGVLDGRPVFARTTGDAIDGSAGLAAVADARFAMQAAAGLRRVTVDAPVRVAAQLTVTGTSETTRDVVTSSVVTVNSIATHGPTLIATGDRGECTVAGTATAGPSGCSRPGTALIIAGSRTSINTHANTLSDVMTIRTVTTHERQDETWEVRGRLGNQIGTVHALTGLVALDQADRFVRRLVELDSTPSGLREMATGPERATAGGARWQVFGEAFGRQSGLGADASRGIARSSGDLAGLAGGIGYRAAPGILVGAALQWGNSTMRVKDPIVPERLAVDLTQIGLFGSFRDGPASLGASLAYGTGRARTGIGGAMAGRGVTTFSAAARLGYDLSFGPLVVTPDLGLRYGAVRAGGFAEMGGSVPLVGSRETIDATRGWLGVSFAAPFRHDGMAFAPRAYLRLTHDFGAAGGRAEVAFAALPGMALTAFGPGIGRFGAEFGASVEARLTPQIGIFAAYDGRLAERFQSHTASGGLRIVW
ncbi:Extracellular serine protease precursor [bacterium YEK0313]|nr:Extracellular serine protease precursor [bacterium YEK0313]